MAYGAFFLQIHLNSPEDSGAGEVLWMRALKYAKLTAQAKAGLMPSLVRAAMPWRQRDPGLRSIMIGKAKGATSEDGRRA
jgi:hypothetical protein